MKKSITAALAILVFLAASPARAAEKSGPVPSCADCGGFLWYDDPAPEEKKKDAKPEEPDPLDIPMPYTPPRLKERFSYNALMKMHPKQLRVLHDLYLEKGVWDPSPENVTDYYVVLNAARLKSLSFARVADYVANTNPALSAADAVPVAPVDIAGRNDAERKEKERLINESANDFAVLYFFSQTCKACAMQAPVNASFAQLHNWNIEPVEVELNAGLVERFNIQNTPSMVLIYQHNKKQWFPLRAGFISRFDMEHSIYSGIRLLRGDITPEQWAMSELQKGGSMDPESYKEDYDKKMEKRYNTPEPIN